MSAEVPELSVTPSNVSQDLAAHQEHSLEFTFTNEDAEKKIYNVTLEDRPYLNWTEEKFHVNASQSETVEAEFYTETPTRVNDSFSIPYYYNQTEGNNTGITFDKNYYPELRFNVSTYYEETNVSLDVFQRNFTLQFNETESSVFEVGNDGSFTAFSVGAQGEDVSFDPGSRFNLSAGEDELVRYNVSIPKPAENPTNATNQTYTRTVQVSGENFDSVNFTVRVFVPYKEYDEIERQRDIVEYLQEIQDFCSREENQDLPICGGEVVEYQNRTEFINNTPVYQANFTEAERDALVQYANASSDKYNDILERVRLQQNTIRSEQEKTRKAIGSNLTQVANETRRNSENIDRLVEELRQQQEERQERRESRRTLTMVGAIFLFFLVMIYIGFKVLVKISEASSDNRV
ncbi:hypothetical protein [Haloarcula japonica]|uniref:COG1470 family protein n=1 Tax=Haloarcula japonica TaxID=29282 RepID=UPI0039F74154